MRAKGGKARTGLAPADAGGVPSGTRSDDQRRHVMDSQESERTAPLARRGGPDATAAQIAQAMAEIWREISVVLSPIIGSRGVAALYGRSLYLTAAAHPWLAALSERQQAEMDLAALEALAARQSSADATAGGTALLQAFHQLLASLIGPALTARLLRSVWADSSSGPPPAQDKQP